MSRLSQHETAAVARCYDDLRHKIAPDLLEDVYGRLEQLVVEASANTDMVLIKVSSAEVSVLQRTFKRHFRGDSMQSFTRSGAKKCLKESTVLNDLSKGQISKQVREATLYESQMLHRIGTRILEQFDLQVKDRLND